MGDAPLWFKLCFYGVLAWIAFIWIKMLLWDAVFFDGWRPRAASPPQSKKGTSAGGIGSTTDSISPSFDATHDSSDSSFETADMSYDSGGSDSGGGDFSGGGGDYGGGGSGGSWS